MKFNNRKMRMEYRGNSWCFVDGPNMVKFDQAVVDVTFSSKHLVEGFVQSVHGVDQEIAQFLDSRTRQDIGIKSVHSLGNGPTIRRVRLMPGGEVERVS